MFPCEFCEISQNTFFTEHLRMSASATSNEGIRNVMARSRFEDILQNLHFSGNAKDDKSDKDYKVRSLINHFNQSFSKSVSDDDA